jgi:hypothetical protein
LYKSQLINYQAMTAAKCCFGEEEKVVEKQPLPSSPPSSSTSPVVPYLPARTTSIGRDIFLVEGPVTMAVNGKVLEGKKLLVCYF